MGHDRGDRRRVLCPDRVRERTEGGGGYSCVVSFGKWFTEKYFVNHFLIFYT